MGIFIDPFCVRLLLDMDQMGQGINSNTILLILGEWGALLTLSRIVRASARGSFIPFPLHHCYGRLVLPN